jgi:hypothetical protein
LGIEHWQHDDLGDIHFAPRSYPMADVTHILSQIESCDSPSPSCSTSLSGLRSGVWSKSNFLSVRAGVPRRPRDHAAELERLTDPGTAGRTAVAERRGSRRYHCRRCPRESHLAPRPPDDNAPPPNRRRTADHTRGSRIESTTLKGNHEHFAFRPTESS